MDDLTADRLALRYLAETYAIGCDDRDAELLTSVFADGATMTIHWLDRGPGQMTLPADIGRIPTGLSRYDRTMHLIGNHRAVIDGDTASGDTYCIAHHLTGTNDYIMAIRYRDRYERRPEGWKIVERSLHTLWTDNVEVEVR